MKVLRYWYYGLTIAMLCACATGGDKGARGAASLSQSSAAQAQAIAAQHGWRLKKFDGIPWRTIVWIG